MSELSDRLIILLMVATLLFGVLIGWGGGIVEAALGGMRENVTYAVLAVVFVVILIGIWWGFDLVD